MRQVKVNPGYEQAKATYNALCKETFTTPSGKRFLNMLRMRYMDAAMFAPDPNIMARNAAQFDMINEFVQAVRGDLDVNPE